jgi:hypothetical protein
MEALTRIIRQRRENRRYAMEVEIELVCRIFASSPETEYAIRGISEGIGICETIIRR